MFPQARVAVLTTGHHPLDVRIFHKELKSLRKAGFDIAFFAPTQPDAGSVLDEAGIRYVPLGEFTGRFSRAKLTWRVMQELKGSEFTVWHFHEPELLLLAVISQWLFQKSAYLVYDCHEDFSKDILDKDWIPGWLRKPTALVFNLLERTLIRQCKLVVAATDSIREHLKTNAGNAITVHNYPVLNELEARKVSGASQVRVIYVGNISEIRGLREVVLAIKSLKDRHIELNLLGGIYPEEFAEEMAVLADENVKIWGKVSFAETFDALRNSDIGIVCFRPLHNHVEAMPNKLFEYLEAGLPVVASNFPLWEDIIVKNGCGITVNPLDVDEIASALRTLALAPEIRVQMGEAARRAAMHYYSWQNEECVLLTAYRQMLNG